MKQVAAGGAQLPHASPPSRGRGLKRLSWAGCRTLMVVAPLAGAWIETGAAVRCRPCLTGRWTGKATRLVKAPLA